MTDSSKESTTTLFGCILVIALTMILGGLSSLILLVNPFMDPKLFFQGFFVSCIVFLIGVSSIVFFGNRTGLKYGILGGFGISFAFLVYSLILLLPTIMAAYPVVTAGIAILIMIVTGTPIVFTLRKRIDVKLPSIKSSDVITTKKTAGKREVVQALEITLVPSDYLSSYEGETKRKLPYEMTLQILQTLVDSKIPYGIRIQKTQGRIQLFLMTWGKGEEGACRHQDALARIVSSIMPKFRFAKIPSFSPFTASPGMNIGAASMVGDPLLDNRKVLTAEGLTTVAEFLRALDGDGVIQIRMTPKRAGYFRRRRVENEYKEQVESSQHGVVVTRPGFLGSSPIQESHTSVDPKAISKLQRASRELKRVQKRLACEVQIMSFCRHSDKEHAKTSALQLLRILAGSVGSADDEKSFRIRESKGWERPVLFGISGGPSTLLTPEEAALFCILPLCDLGFSVSDRERFHTNPGGTGKTAQIRAGVSSTGAENYVRTSKGSQKVVLGRILGEGQTAVGNLEISRDVFAEHSGIFGNSGSGKTTTAMSIVFQLYKQGVVPLILVPSKATDWRDLLDAIPETRVFTIGEDTTAPLRLNPFRVPSGVLLNSYIGAVTSCFTAAWPSEGMIKEQVQNVINTVFKNAGWNRRLDKRGRPILLQDVFNAVLQVEQTYLHYSDRLNQDFVGALKARFATLLQDPLLPIFNCWPGISVEELLAKPTIIEIHGLDDEQKALVSSLLIMKVASHLEALTRQSETRTKGLKHLLVLEEAHQLLERVGSSKELHEGHSAKQMAIKSIVNTLREARGCGLGVVLIDQLPLSLAEYAIKLPGTTIIHYLKHPNERMEVGLQANCSEKQIRHIGAMDLGEAVVHVARTSQPVNVRVTPLSVTIPGFGTGKVWTDRRVAERMKKVYKENPHFKEWVEIASDPLTLASQDALSIPHVQTKVREQSLDSVIVEQLLLLTENSLFKKAYPIAVGHAVKGNPTLASLVIKRLVMRVVNSDDDLRVYCDYLTWYLSRKKPESEWKDAHSIIADAVRNEVAAEGAA